MKRSFFLGLSFFASIVSAAVCENAWDGDQLVRNLSGRSASQILQLKPTNGSSETLKFGQIIVFHSAMQRISFVAGLHSKFFVCGDSEPNAFASSGANGEIVGVTVGMLRLADGDPDVAAAVIGHEFAHHVKKHGTTSKTRNNILQVIGAAAGMVLEYNLQKKHGVQGFGMDIGQFGATLLSRKFDRDQEIEADDLGFTYMLSAGFNPNGAVELAKRLNGYSNNGNFWFLSTHPEWGEREEFFKRKIANNQFANC